VGALVQRAERIPGEPAAEIALTSELHYLDSFSYRACTACRGVHDKLLLLRLHTAHCYHPLTLKEYISSGAIS
jgi:hypothetical protein